MSARELITEHLDLWTGAVTKKSSSGRGSSGKVELTGVKKLRELILELAVRGKLVTQDKDDEPIDLLFEKIESEKSAQLKAKKIRKPKVLPEVQATEQPFPIPESWRYCRLNELGAWGSGATPKRGNAHYYGGGIPWFKSGELYEDFIDSSEETITELALQETSVRMNQPGDVLIAMYGATIGKASILEVAGTTNQAVCACTPWSGISNRFLLLLLKAYRSRFIAMGAGGAQPNISREKIIATVVGLPPEQEQHRIVQKVDELMALCDRLEQQTGDQLEAHETLVDTLLGTLLKPAESSLTQSKNATELADNWAHLAAHFDTLFTTEQSIDKLRQTILQLAVMGRLVEIDPSDEPASALLEEMEAAKKRLMDEGKLRKLKSLPPIAKHEIPFKLPEGWQWCRLSDVASVVDPNPSHRMPKYVKNGIPFISTENFAANDTIDFSIGKLVPESVLQNQINKFDIREGAFAISRIGTIGKTRVLPTKRNYCMSHALCVISPYADVFDHSYLRFVVSAESSLAQAQHGVQSIGVPDLGVGSIRSLLIPVPPKNKQGTIVSKINELIALCDQLKERLNQASETRCHLAEAAVEGALN